MNARRVKDIDYQLLPGTKRKTTDIVIERNAPGLVDPAKVGLIEPLVGLLLLPVMIVYRFIFGQPSDRG